MLVGRLLVILVLAGASAGAADPVLFPISQNGLWGFIDRSGRVVIEPRFEETYTLKQGCRPFRDGLQPVRVGDRWGYVDARGALAIPARFRAARCFSEGLAAALPGDVQREVQWGYIDRRGDWAIPPAFRLEPQPFSQGLAPVWVKGEVGYVDRRGRLAIPARSRSIPECSSFAEGLACFEENELWGFMDRRGRTVIPAQFESVGRFAEGRAAFARGRFQLYGYFDRTGRVVIPEQFKAARGFAGGRAEVTRYHGRTAFIDHSGKPVFTLDGYHPVEAFSDGLALVAVTDAQRATAIGYVDAGGQFAIPPRFRSGTSFVNGLAFVEDCGVSGYIDTTGAAVWGLAARPCAATPPPAASRLSGDAIARASGHPGPLNLTPVPTSTTCTPFGREAWGVTVAAADGSFAPAALRLVERGGSEWTAAMEQEIHQPSAAGRSGLVRPVASHRGGITLVTWGAVATMIPSPDDGFELLVTVPDSDGLKANPAAQAYQRRLRTDPRDITEAIAVAAWDALYRPAARPPAR